MKDWILVTTSGKELTDANLLRSRKANQSI
jgi:hypothetical protein